MSRNRKEFPRQVRVDCVKRATRKIGDTELTETYCEECHGPTHGKFEIDHVDPDALTGKPVLENARLLCIPCHRIKTSKDVAVIAKAKRVEARHVGITKPKGQLKGPCFPTSGKVRTAKPQLPPPRWHQLGLNTLDPTKET